MSQLEIGQRNVLEAVTTGGSALEVLQRLAPCANDASTVDLLGGAVGALVGIYRNLKNQGLPMPDFKDQRLNEFLALSPAVMSATLSEGLSTRHKDALANVGALCAAVDKYRGKIKLAADQPTKPIEVVVLSLPTRTTETEVQRDRNGKIESTTQVERDI